MNKEMLNNVLNDDDLVDVCGGMNDGYPTLTLDERHAPVGQIPQELQDKLLDNIKQHINERNANKAKIVVLE